jgi:hypothetical protein
MIITYKRRHDEIERAFLEKLEDNFIIEVSQLRVAYLYCYYVTFMTLHRCDCVANIGPCIML